jgi:hypothetical protein
MLRCLAIESVSPLLVLGRESWVWSSASTTHDSRLTTSHLMKSHSPTLRPIGSAIDFEVGEQGWSLLLQ